MQMGALFPLAPADVGAAATVLELQRRNSGSPRGKELRQRAGKVNDMKPGASPHMQLHAGRAGSYCRAGRYPEGSGRLGGGTFIRQQSGWFPHRLETDHIYIITGEE